MSTVTEHPNATLVRRGYEAFNTGDGETLSVLFSPDVTFLQPGRSSVSGLYDGRDAVFGFFGALAAETGGTFRAELTGLYANETQVVALNKATGTRDSATLDTDAALVFEIADGVVTAITAHQERQQDWDEFFV